MSKENYSSALENLMSSEQWYNGDHEKIAIEELPEPLNWFVSELVRLNKKTWITEDKYRTYGADRVRRFGLTENQYRWLRVVLSGDEPAFRDTPTSEGDNE